MFVFLNGTVIPCVSYIVYLLSNFRVRPSLTDGPGGMYQQVSPDGSRPGIFYANLFHPDER